MSGPTRGFPFSFSLAIIFVLALGLRVAHLAQIREIGFLRHPTSDGLIYHQRAREIAAGDWLGSADFVHAPGYAYLLGLIYTVAGDGPWGPRIAQALGGAAACVLLALAARRLFDDRGALLAGVLLAIYPPAIFFDGILQKASLTLLLCTAMLWLAVRAAMQPAWFRWLAAGIALGLLCLTRQNALVLVPLLALWAALSSGDRGTLHTSPRRANRRAIDAVVVLVAALATLAPWAARNRVVTGSWTLTTPNLGQNFAMGNHPDATGTYLPQRRGYGSAEREQRAWTRAAEKALGRRLSPAEVSDYYRDAALTWIRDNPGAWLQLTLRKTLMTWGAYEAPDTEDYYLYLTRASLLRFLDTIWHFGVLAPLAAMGILLTRDRWRRLWPLYGWLLLNTLAVAAFVVFARYRLPLVPVCVMFAAAGISSAARALGERRLRSLAIPVATAVVIAAASNWPIHHPRRPQVAGYLNHARALADGQRYTEAADETRRALALDSRNVDASLMLGSIQLDVGDLDGAYVSFESARANDPDEPTAQRGLGDTWAARGDLARAGEHYRRALALDPEDVATLTALGGIEARAGRLNDAHRLLTRAIALEPRYARAHLNLGSTYLSAGRMDQAVAAYEQALSIAPDFVDALFNLGIVALQRGQGERAVAHLERALALRPQREDIRAALAQARGMRR
jgi:tetratricopeptide (TPR) repeat protein